MNSSPGCLTQMVAAYQKLEGGNILAIEEAAEKDLRRYGVVDIGTWDGNCCSLLGMVEKPDAGQAPSNSIISGRYILQPEIFDVLEHFTASPNKEIQITDAMLQLARDQKFYGLKYNGRSFDCGDKIGFLAANVAFGLAHEELGENFKKKLVQLVADAGGNLKWTNTK
jgi:UTP--glucose-1-phosphate uridylyltransferase